MQSLRKLQVFRIERRADIRNAHNPNIRRGVENHPKRWIHQQQNDQRQVPAHEGHREPSLQEHR